VHANKSWSEVAAKNFYKAMDLKGFEFKKNEKERMKSNYFITELQERAKILENGGEARNNMITFEDKKDFFTILNSF
jgi:histone deacetylase complex regulatory component SIN3